MEVTFALHSANFSLSEGLTIACFNDILFQYFRRLSEAVRGGMAERLMALVLKTSDAERHRGFESLSLRHFLHIRSMLQAHGEVPKWPKGLPC